MNLSFDKKQRRNYLRMELLGVNATKLEYRERRLLRISDKVCVLRGRRFMSEQLLDL